MPFLPYVIDLILWLLGFFSVLTWTIIVVKMVVFTRQRLANARFLSEFDKLDKMAGLPKLVHSQRGQFSDLAQATLDELYMFAKDQILDTQSRADMLRNTLSQERRGIMIRLEIGLAALASIGSISTILGLLGTVWSIMNLLKAISGTTTTGLDIVAGPIGDALITTAVGIIVAVPALLAHNFFVRRVRVAMTNMDRFSERLQHLAMRSSYRAD